MNEGEGSVHARLQREALDLFEELSELDALETSRRLGAVVQARPELAAEVRRLLEAEAGGGLRTDLGLDAELPCGLSAGARIGAYRVVSELGHGGMGRVYLGARADGAFEQRVAIKTMRGFLGVDLRPRFERERQILARLDHPAIAKVFDGGATDRGQPYLVMELIDGEPIDRFCDQRRLSIEDRLRLFRQVCEAVQHAHSNLIVHRDLKPSNILVTPEGRPKLLDFGIAKLLDRGGESAAVAETVAAARVLTPEFASPEQLRGETITTASDVYSLGVLLYVLLTGRHPYAEAGATPRQLEESALTRQVVPPSAVASRGGAGVAPGEVAAARRLHPRELRRRLRGDLDHIVLRALRREPERRYATPAELADDIGRHLGGVPVEAHPDSRAYRARRFVARHRLAVAAAALVVASLVGGLLVSLRQTRLAERERHKAERIAEVLQGMLAAPNSAWDAGGRAPDVKVVDVLEEARARLDDLAEDPEVEAALRRTLGRTLSALGRHDLAQAELERAVELYRRVHGPAHDDTLRARYLLATSFLHASEWARGEAILREVLAVCEREACSGALVPESLNYLASALRIQGELDESGAMLDRAQALLEPDDLAFPIVLANLGELRLAQGQRDEARRALDRSLAAFARLGGEPIEELSATLGLAWLEYMEGNFTVAEPLYRRAVEMSVRLLAANNPAHIDARLGWAAALVELGDHAGARREGHAAIEAVRKTLADQPEVVWSVRRAYWGEILCLGGDVAVGMAELERAVELMTGQARPQQWRRAEAQARLGRCLLAQGRREDGLARLELAVRGMEEVLDDGDPRLILPRRWLEEARSSGGS